MVSSTKMLGSFRSVAMTTPLEALMPREVAPALTAFSAYSIWTSLPLGLKVVREKEYCTVKARVVCVLVSIRSDLGGSAEERHMQKGGGCVEHC